jgi:hypothetical protein
MTRMRRFPPFAGLHGTTGVDPMPSLATSRAGSQGDQKAVIRVRLLVILADWLMSVRREAPLPLSDRRCRSPR